MIIEFIENMTDGEFFLFLIALILFVSALSVCVKEILDCEGDD